jgi:site-specific DNA recombinase
MSKKNEIKKIRCAIYTRKSTDERLDLEFNSLDSQRASAEAFIVSQRSEGWVCLPKKYDDGGFSGGDLDRPALNELLKDIAAGEVDCVVVYKVDRLSRSLFDFAMVMGKFDEYGASFVSVTQQFNTTHSMGRLTLNILLSFAQFEREIIGERIRDKIAAQRQKGLWCGGQPVLGYDVDRSATSPKLVINAEEAAKVRDIFEFYLKLRSLLPVVEKVQELGWTNKTWLTRAGRRKGRRPLDKGSIHAILTNVIYIGKLRHKDQIHDGVHEAIVTQETFEAVQKMLKEHRRGSGRRLVNRHNALLKGLLFCPLCGYGMIHKPTKKNSKVYRYYVCQTAIKRGYGQCQTGSIPAPAIEQAVVEELRCIVEDEGLKSEVYEQSMRLTEKQRSRLELQLRQLNAQHSRDLAELGRMDVDGLTGQLHDLRRDELQQRLDKVKLQVGDIEVALAALRDRQFERRDVEEALSDFEHLWSLLRPKERIQLVELLVERVEYDCGKGALDITYRPTSIASLITHDEEEA